MLRKCFAILLSLCMMLLCFGCQNFRKTAEWTAASLRNEDGYFILPGAKLRATVEEVEKIMGYDLEPMEPVSAYSLAESRRYVPANIGREEMMVALYGCKAVPGFIFDLTETNGNADGLDSVTLYFEGRDAAKVAEKFLVDAVELWGEPTSEHAGESSIAVAGKKEPTQTLQQTWRVDSDEYITVLGAGTITHNGEIIRFMLEWGTCDAADH